MRDIDLFIFASDPLARAGLAVLVADLPGLNVLGQRGALDGFDLDDGLQPDVLLWDLGWEPPVDLPDLSALAAPVLALIPDGEDARAAWAAGVRGLLRRDCEAVELAAALPALAAGLMVVEPTFVPQLLGQPAGLLAGPDEELTPREQEVLNLLAEGVTNKAISFQLHISEHTVKFHVNAIMNKLGAQSRTEAVVLATRMGLILL